MIEQVREKVNGTLKHILNVLLRIVGYRTFGSIFESWRRN